MNNPPTIWASPSIMCSCWFKKKTNKKKSFPAKDYISQPSMPSLMAKRLGSANQLWIEVIVTSRQGFLRSLYSLLSLSLSSIWVLWEWMQGLQEGRNLDLCIPAERKPTHQAGLSTLNWLETHAFYHWVNLQWFSNVTACISTSGGCYKCRFWL